MTYICLFLSRPEENVILPEGADLADGLVDAGGIVDVGSLVAGGGGAATSAYT